MGVEFVQTDSKGHPGYVSWFSETPEASIAPGVVQDALAQWRAATRLLGIPLHAHYSGIWDSAAGARHPEWRLLTAQKKPVQIPEEVLHDLGLRYSTYEPRWAADMYTDELISARPVFDVQALSEDYTARTNAQSFERLLNKHLDHWRKQRIACSGFQVEDGAGILKLGLLQP